MEPLSHGRPAGWIGPGTLTVACPGKALLRRGFRVASSWADYQYELCTVFTPAAIQITSLRFRVCSIESLCLCLVVVVVVVVD